ncbi:MAG: hypothetical protein N2257_01235 [Thermodesulfovibrionales bacterium]|nr:hypothetical protein [Thermodesulfovibrionales bacterium]
MKPLIILIGGSYSGAGKTTFGSQLLKYLGGNWGVIKYTKTGFYSSIIDTEELISQKNKDTGKYIEAGAEEVLWLQGPRESLSEMLDIAITRLSTYRGIIIEGNSPIEFLDPDIVVFLDGEERPPKPSSEKVKKRADIIIKIKDMKDGLEKTKDLIQQKEILAQELIKRAVNKRITCKAARELAESLGFSYREVGRAADSMGIKITNCELGCF